MWAAFEGPSTVSSNMPRLKFACEVTVNRGRLAQVLFDIRADTFLRQPRP